MCTLTGKIPTPAEQAERYALMCERIIGQGYRNITAFDLVASKAAKLTLAEFRPANVVLGHPESWAPLRAVWVDTEGTIWPQVGYTSNDRTVRDDLVRRAIETENKAVTKRLGKPVRAYLASLL